MQYLYDQFGLATSDDYELGMRYDYSRFHIAPSVFYDKYRNKLLTIWDPIAQRTIRQAIGNSRVKGAELEAGQPVPPVKRVYVVFV
jgi:iron complex outermembrane recepter protein